MKAQDEIKGIWKDSLYFCVYFSVLHIGLLLSSF